MILSELIDRLADLEKRHGPNVEVALIVKNDLWPLPVKYVFGQKVYSVGTSGRPALKDKIVIYGLRDGKK